MVSFGIRNSWFLVGLDNCWISLFIVSFIPWDYDNLVCRVCKQGAKFVGGRPRNLG